jgi:hypothetical protein
VTYGEDVIRGENVSLGTDIGWDKLGPWKSWAWGQDVPKVKMCPGEKMGLGRMRA